MSCEPSTQSIEMTSRMPGSTAVANSVLPKMRASPVRTLPTAVTPGTSSTASEAAVGMGEKLFCAVIA